MAKKHQPKRPRHRHDGESQAEERQRRKARALRENLKKRKDQARQKASFATDA